MTVPMVVYKWGPRTFTQYTPGSSYRAGDVIVVNNYPLIADADNPPNAQDSARQGALAIKGGVYAGPCDATIPAVGAYVFWDATNLVFTSTSSGNTPFGWLIAGPTGVSSDAGPAASGNTVFVLHDPDSKSAPPLQYVEMAASTAVSNTASETLFSTSYSIPANTLQAGDVLKIRGQGIITAVNSTNTFAFHLYIGGLTGTAIAAIAAANPTANDIFFFDVEVVVRTNGASGTIVGAGVAGQGTPGTGTGKLQFLASTAIDTTSAQVVGISTTQSVANAGNSCRLDILNVSLSRK